MRHFRSVLIPAVLFLLPGLAQADWFWQNPLPQGNILCGVCFSDSTTGYSVGDAGTILKTTDGGSQWSIQSSGTTNRLQSVHFPMDAMTGYAAGVGGTLLKTMDGGTNWTRQTSGTTNGLYSVHFPIDTQTGYAVGSPGPS